MDSLVAISIQNCVFENVGTIFRGPESVDISIVDTRMDGVRTVFEITNTKTHAMVPLDAPIGATRDEIAILMEAARSALTSGRDPVEAISQTPTWDSWASRGANLVTVATPIAEFVKSLF